MAIGAAGGRSAPAKLVTPSLTFTSRRCCEIRRNISPYPMPIYEFYSPTTHKIYSFFARSMAMRQKTPRCPDDPAATMERMVSGFAITGRHKGEEPEGDGLHDDDLKEFENHPDFHEVESVLATMDENNPDPRQLGHVMRKMTNMMGGKVPDAMKEMIGRLEAGEDPDALEEKFGDALEGMDDEFGDGFSDEFKAIKSKVFARKKAPKRDPNLYEFTDYLD